jgi:hypothetical protein
MTAFVCKARRSGRYLPRWNAAKFSRPSGASSVFQESQNHDIDVPSSGLPLQT